jgi:quinol monooxygenase YgiN
MTVVRFKLPCRPEKTAAVLDALSAVAASARQLPGLTHFDIARDVVDDNILYTFEVFEDDESLNRQDALPEVSKVMQLLQSDALSAPSEWTVYQVSSSRSA